MSEERCVHCGHHHYGDIEPDENGTRWCDTAICGDGCCHCACYTPVYRDGPRLVVRQPATETESEQRAIHDLRQGIAGFVPHPNSRIMDEALDVLVAALAAVRAEAGT